MYGESTSKELDTQLSLLYRQECGDLNVTIASIQQQNGGADCGLFAIAVCLSLAVKVDPSKVRWRQMKMRKHLSEIFKSEKIIQFPTIQGKHLKVQNELAQYTISLWCVCRLPTYAFNHMVECPNCQRWYHKPCMGAETLQR